MAGLLWQLAAMSASALRLVAAAVAARRICARPVSTVILECLERQCAAVQLPRGWELSGS